MIGEASLAWDLVSSIAWAFVCWFIAKRIGRNPVFAAVLGFIGGVFAGIGYFVLMLIDGRRLKKQRTTAPLLPSRPDQERRDADEG